MGFKYITLSWIWDDLGTLAKRGARSPSFALSFYVACFAVLGTVCGLRWPEHGKSGIDRYGALFGLLSDL